MLELFVIEAEATWEIDAGGSAEHQMIIARIKDENGEPVVGLKKKNLKVFQLGKLNPGAVNILNVNESNEDSGNLPGTYSIRLDEKESLLTGQFVFALVVTKKGPTLPGAKEGPPVVQMITGQTLMSVVKLK